MDYTHRAIIVLLVIVVMLLVFLLILAYMAYKMFESYLSSISLNQIQLATRVSSRVSTARPLQGDGPPHVEEERRIGVARRGKRRVVGGDPESDQHSHLERGLAHSADSGGVE